MSALAEAEIVDLICRGIDPRTGGSLNTPRDPKVDRIRLSLLSALNALGKGAMKPDGATTGHGEFRNKGKKWTPDDESRLTSKWKSGANLDSMTEEFGRTAGALAARLVHLEVEPDRETTWAANVKRGGSYGKEEEDEGDPIKLVDYFILEQTKTET